MARVTIRDVAKKANVSITTVSHVINGTRFVEEATTKKVLDAIEALNYTVNSAARSLRAGKSATIGLVVPDTANLFFAEFLRRIEDFSFKSGYNLIICNTDNDLVKEDNYLNALISKQVDGVIYISSGGDSEHLKTFDKYNIPVVIADREVPTELADIVMLNNERAGYDVATYLINSGHKVIGCITGPDRLSPSSQRLQGFIRAHEELGVTFYPELVTTGKFTLASGYTSFDILWQQKHKPTALFVFSDMMAIGAMHNAISRGLKVPEDLSFVGFDDIELASVMRPALTTYSQPIGKMAETIIDLLLDRIKNNEKETRKIYFRGSLIVRESTRVYKEPNG